MLKSGKWYSWRWRWHIADSNSNNSQPTSAHRKQRHKRVKTSRPKAKKNNNNKNDKQNSLWLPSIEPLEIWWKMRPQAVFVVTVPYHMMNMKRKRNAANSINRALFPTLCSQFSQVKSVIYSALRNSHRRRIVSKSQKSVCDCDRFRSRFIFVQFHTAIGLFLPHSPIHARIWQLSLDWDANHLFFWPKSEHSKFFSGFSK